MKLYLCQHGECLSKEEDPNQPLSPLGVDDIGEMAEFLGELDLNIKEIFYSVKLRAQQTAKILADEICPNAKIEEIEGLKPMDDIKSIALMVDQIDHDTLIVGHMPFMQRLVGLLVMRDEDAKLVSFEQGSMACLEKTENGWSIYWMLNPELF